MFFVSCLNLEVVVALSQSPEIFDVLLLYYYYLFFVRFISSLHCHTNPHHSVVNFKIVSVQRAMEIQLTDRLCYCMWLCVNVSTCVRAYIHTNVHYAVASHIEMLELSTELVHTPQFQYAPFETFNYLNRGNISECKQIVICFVLFFAFISNPWENVV